MFSLSYLKDLLERAVATFAQALIAAGVVLPSDFWAENNLKLAGGAALLSVLKGLVAKYKGDSGNASLV